MLNKKLAQEIISMAKLDQTVRKAKRINWMRMKQIDRRNSFRMKGIVATFGWPSVKLVGKRVEHLAWLLVQHTPDDVDFQETCLRLMKQVKASSVDIAFLTDRILVNKGLPQMYGTQYTKLNGKTELVPIQKPKGLTSRRKRMGLMPLTIP